MQGLHKVSVASEQFPHELKVLGRELVFVVHVEDVLLAHAAFDGGRHFDLAGLVGCKPKKGH